MKPGAELDALIAEKILGYKVHDGRKVRGTLSSGIPPYSRDIEWAWQVVKELSPEYKIQSNKGLEICFSAAFMKNGRGKLAYSESAPMAICIAALKAGYEMEGLG
ncbi:hypothetical protein JOD43_002148 [Pullulanibacillus pueri]|uniref:Phage ABA sandwich domain-containing protein n=1 Tax=Pullulanibacillus pueri TaxID=1437324 RepID=A0A8J2ZWG4_9BACL|nr:hypothetical protein [Pullulanibacillus pueri]MBM7681976.1 hypothetical protein [Pullulanibacillus pueri]GGH83644.1 hypothetical protein GCM10007096_24870 [Pullulanibacillus pueri]